MVEFQPQAMCETMTVFLMVALLIAVGANFYSYFRVWHIYHLLLRLQARLRLEDCGVADGLDRILCDYYDPPRLHHKLFRVIEMAQRLKEELSTPIQGKVEEQVHKVFSHASVVTPLGVFSFGRFGIVWSQVIPWLFVALGASTLFYSAFQIYSLAEFSEDNIALLTTGFSTFSASLICVLIWFAARTILNPGRLRTLLRVCAINILKEIGEPEVIELRIRKKVVKASKVAASESRLYERIADLENRLLRLEGDLRDGRTTIQMYRAKSEQWLLEKQRLQKVVSKLGRAA